MQSQKNQKMDKNHYNASEREKWGSKIDFMFSFLGLCIGLGNVWRFPYLCFRNGGGAFLIPYLLCVVLAGIPMTVMELGLGQYMKLSGWQVWRITPILQGIGFTSLFITCYIAIYYVMVLSWSVYYFVYSLRSDSMMPWSHCNNAWNTPRCGLSNEIKANVTYGHLPNTTYIENSSEIGSMKEKPFFVDPAVEFWRHKAMELSDGIESTDGVLLWQQTLCLLFAWTCIYFCLWRGLKWTGKVTYITVSFPYILLTIFLVRGVTLDGAIDGITYYMKPDFSRLKDPKVWTDGATQVLFSYVVGFGCLTTLGSYNEFNNDFFRQGIILSFINSGTSLYCGFAVFSVLGFMAKNQGVHISEVADRGPGLIFITYPKAISQLPLPALWSALFFLMIFFVGIDSLFVPVEAVITPLVDKFPHRFQSKKGRMVLVAALCSGSFLIDLMFVTRKGLYIFQIFDYFSGSGMVLLWVLFWQSIAIGWCFGIENFCDAVEAMIGYRPNRWFPLLLKYVAPVFSMAIFISQVLDVQPLKYNEYQFPEWSFGIGILLSMSSMIMIPLVAVIKIFRTKGTFLQRLQNLRRADFSVEKHTKEMHHEDCATDWL